MWLRPPIPLPEEVRMEVVQRNGAERSVGTGTLTDAQPTTVDTNMCAPTASPMNIPASPAPTETTGSLSELAAIQADLSRFAGRAFQGHLTK